MKPEISQNKKGAENQRQIEEKKFTSFEEQENLELDESELILKLKKMIDQGVATLNFEKDQNNEITSLTIRETKGGKILFGTDNQTWSGKRAIEKIIGSTGKELQ